MGLFGYTVYYRSIYLHVHLMVVEYVLSNKPQFDPREVLSKLALRYLLRLMRRCYVPFSSDSTYDSVAYDLVKARLLEPEAEAEGSQPSQSTNHSVRSHAL